MCVHVHMSARARAHTHTMMSEKFRIDLFYQHESQSYKFSLDTMNYVMLLYSYITPHLDFCHESMELQHFRAGMSPKGHLLLLS